MRRLRIGMIDLVTKQPTRSPWGRLMYPNFASIMPQAIALWCDTGGPRHPADLLHGPRGSGGGAAAGRGPGLHRGFLARGATRLRPQQPVPVQGDRHRAGRPARPELSGGARLYFDYVLGFTDETVVGRLLSDCSPHRRLGIHLSAKRQSGGAVEPESPAEARRADALGLVAESALAGRLRARAGDVSTSDRAPKPESVAEPRSGSDPEATPEPNADAEAKFYRPDGRPFPTVPPPVPVPEDPVGALEREQRELEIDAWTPTPDWDGLPLDVDWALFTLWQPGREDAAGADFGTTTGT